MKKNDKRITRRDTIIDERPMRAPVIDDGEWEVVDEYTTDNPKHHHHEEYCPQTPPRPVPPKPQPTEIKFGDGLRVDKNVVSVNIDEHCGNYIYATKKGISIEPLLYKLDKITSMLSKLDKRLTDAESDINKLKKQARPEVITQTIVDKSESFELSDNGKIGIKTNDGIKIGDDGYLQINGDESLLVGEDGKVGVDYDGDTLDLITDADGNQRLSTVSSDWVLGDWNTETEEDGN